MVKKEQSTNLYWLKEVIRDPVDEILAHWQNFHVQENA